MACKASGIHSRSALAWQRRGEDGQNCCPASHPAITTVRHETFPLSCSAAQQNRGLCQWCDSRRGAEARGLLHRYHRLGNHLPFAVVDVKGK